MQALTRINSVLRCLAQGREPMTLADLSEAVDLPKPTVFRLAQALNEAGWVVRSEGGHYSLGPALAAIARQYFERHSLVSIAGPILDDLRNQTSETASISVRIGPARTYLAEAPSRHPMRFVHELDQQEPLHAGASGKVLLAYLTEELRRDVIDAGRDLFPTVPIPTGVESGEELDVIRERGWAISYGEKTHGAVGLAVPVTDPLTDTMYSLAIFTPAVRFEDAAVDSLVRALIEAGDRLVEQRRLDIERLPQSLPS